MQQLSFISVIHNNLQFTNLSKLYIWIFASVKKDYELKNSSALVICALCGTTLSPPLCASCVCKSHLSNFCVIYSPLKENQTTRLSSPPQRRCCRNKKSDALGNIENRVSFFAWRTQSSTPCVAWIEFPSPWGIRRRALMTQKCQWNLLNSGRNGGGGRSSSELLCPEIAN